jgi:hypothetical protein
LKHRLSKSDELLSRKEAQFLIGKKRTTFWRIEQQLASVGVYFVRGRISPSLLAWGMERLEAMRILKIAPDQYQRLARRERERLMERAMRQRAILEKRRVKREKRARANKLEHSGTQKR